MRVTEATREGRGTLATLATDQACSKIHREAEKRECFHARVAHESEGCIRKGQEGHCRLATGISLCIDRPTSFPTTK